MARSLTARRRVIAVVCGGFLGTIARYLLSGAIQRWLGSGWPYDIFIINVTGAFILSLVTALADATFLIGPTRRLFINVGFLGAFTTFSTFMLGDILMFMNGHRLLALIYIVTSILGGVLAVIFGDMAGQQWIRGGRRAGLAASDKLARPQAAKSPSITKPTSSSPPSSPSLSSGSYADRTKRK